MKKTIALVSMILAVLLLTACSNSMVDETPTDTTTTIGEVTEDATEETTEDATEEIVEPKLTFDVESLVTAYCSGEWDGTFISDEKNCASIIEGELWINCESEGIPDMGNTDTSILIDVLKSDVDGTWVHDRSKGLIERWIKGERIDKIQLSMNYLKVEMSGELIMVRHGENLWIYNLECECIQTIENVVDSYFNEGEVMYSDFEHNNFSVNANGEITKLETSYVRFPRKSQELQQATNKTLIESILDLYHNTDWDGSFMIKNGCFVAIDYNGNIIINNKIVANVSLGNYLAKETQNIILDSDKSYYLTGYDLATFVKGEGTYINVPRGNARFLAVSDDCIAIQVYGKEAESTVCIIRLNDRKAEIISMKALDAFVAYDTLYYMEGETVYSLEWENVEADSTVFVAEGAIAVSNYGDEAEGAIVHEELSNYEAYGYTNLYSPYGK